MARLLALAGVLALALLPGCASEEDVREAATSGTGVRLGERGAGLGADDVAIGSLRILLETGTRNGAGTDRPILVWFDNRPHRLSDAPSRDFAPEHRLEATLRGSGLPRTVGELRRASILLTLELGAAAIGSSWFCSLAAVEVRLEGEERYRPYLVDQAVGWLSLDEPPRRSPAYALQ